jgi:DNA-binding response OmpR family regulator
LSARAWRARVPQGTQGSNPCLSAVLPRSAKPSTRTGDGFARLAMIKRRILIVDDEKEIVESSKKRLEREGYQVLTAYDGPQALESAKQHPDLILLDIMMAGMDGVEVLRHLKSSADTSQIPVIMVTARGDSRSIFETQDLESLDYIIKPFEFKELLDLIKRYF